MKKYKKNTMFQYMFHVFLGLLLTGVLSCGHVIAVTAATITAEDMAVYPGVMVSPDHTAWTTDYMDQTNEKLPEGYTISTGQISGLRSLNKGEHYYKAAADGSIRVGKWVVAWKDAQCIHEYAAQNYKGFRTAEGICERYYNNGWNAYCADCNEPVTDMYIYAKSNTVKGILTMPAQSCYVYLCPYCRGLEQGREYQHRCNKISYNYYEISYQKNEPVGAVVTGDMAVTRHMYNNAAIYEGVSAARLGYSDTRLRKLNYECIGYIFTGWNTKEDGSGECFSDEQNVINLSKEEGAVVKLYAQWKPADSTLIIDANGGTYDGKEREYITQGCHTTFEVDNSKLIPTPGYIVEFETNGGSEVENIVTSVQFLFWELQEGAKGSFKENVYTFSEVVGNVDTLKAQYTDVSFVLPESKKENEALVGWYKDAACSDEQFVGLPGDRISVSADTVFYAKWARLTLWAYDDYVSHEGVGAVDLRWEQKDGQGKYYKLYQSENKEDWTNVHAGGSETEADDVSERFEADAQGQKYMIRKTGYYKLVAAGAKGADYDTEYAGGCGGSVTAEYWLLEGDELSFFSGASGEGMTGGSNGSEASGGDSLTEEGRGGGAATEIYLTRAGKVTPLLIAGGGGGATAGFSGGNGGSFLSGVGNMTGEDAQVGGGGGGATGGTGSGAFYRTTRENPVAEDIAFRSVWSTTFPKATQVYCVWKEPQNDSKYPSYYMDYAWKDAYMTNPQIQIGDLGKEIDIEATGTETGEYHYGSVIVQKPGENIPPSFDCYQSYGGFTRIYRADYPVNGNTNLVVSGMFEAWANNAIVASIRFVITDTDSNVVLYDETYVDGASFVNPNDYTSEWRVGVWDDFDIQGTENVRVEVLIYGEGMEAHFNTQMLDTFFYGKAVGVGGSTLGGSNYINPSFGCKNQESREGTNAAAGYALIEGMDVGYIEECRLEDVLARDEAAPKKIERYQITRSDKNELMVYLSEPMDMGTTYYHKAESYRLEGNLLEQVGESNITVNILTTGVSGYYYYVDQNAKGVATEEHSRTGSAEIPVILPDTVVYLHVASVDVAGNIGETADIRLDPELFYPTDKKYPENRQLYTEQLGLEDTEFVYQANEKNYFVKADGMTEHTLLVKAGMDGAAAADFQIDSLWMYMNDNVHREWVRTTIPHGDIARSTEAFSNDKLSMDMSEQEPAILQAKTASAVRISHASEVELVQKFTVPAEAVGFSVCPQAMASFEDRQYFSNLDKDALNCLYIIPDAEAPVIYGLEALESLDVLDMTEQPKTIVLQAADSLSGLQEFWIRIENKDNHREETFTCDSEGKIAVEISKDSTLFIGEITISAMAVDRVSNVNIIGDGGLTFTLETSLYRERNPEENVFKTGDGAVLDIFTSGYVERIEVIFPEELLEVNPELNCVFDYDNPTLRRQETLKFSIPLGIPEQEYEVTVKAYKKGQMLISKPTMVVVEGNVLDELRTRIRNNG